ncbi:unnamed protein product [Rotaria sp. Silwood1]|nr:unnamed protein product [Rotaria sp. Silwood1]CAF3344373.1 unnamed protein product [Rotaria sp. Silwood1]CAF3367666.1 unnamed protein product [Rotaria sp. Silwood1]CAF4626519.1 unnamed protein product [Rotaria sp. Silwood1]CAF4797048.1 unnamed protein product [Rotaria sp. Silwood1]
MSNNIQTSSTAISGFDPHLVRYGSIFLLIVGTFGNIVSFIIFINEALRKSSTFRYLALLSLTDLLVLYSGLLDLFLMIEYGGTFSLRNLNPIACRLHTFITYWSQHSSSWILSFISVDRAIATNRIKFARKFCTPRSAEYIVGIILFFTALFNFHELILLRLQDVNPIEYRNDNPTLLPYHLNITTQEASTSYGFDINNKLLNKRNVQSITSICDNPLWNFLCLRNKRDIFVSNLTTNKLTSKSKITMKKCAPLKDSRYELFWDHVWEWVDVCLYALIPFTIMSIGTFFIVYRVYYQQRRVFRSRRSGVNNSLAATPNKAKSLFYLLFTLNLLYFILVSPVVLVTTILFRNPNEELAYPRLKAIIYLMQYCNHSLNFIFYGITTPPYRRTLCEWFHSLIPHLPQCCQRIIRERSKSIPIQNNIAKQINHNQEKIKRFNDVKSTNITLNDEKNRSIQKESIALIPRL